MYGETIGYSLFDWDTDIEPYGYYSTKRIVGFLCTLGADYKYADMDVFPTALAVSARMNSWPMEGSVQLVEDVIIIKLSDIDN